MIKGWNIDEEKGTVRKAVINTLLATAVIAFLAMGGIGYQISNASPLKVAEVTHMFRTNKGGNSSQVESAFSTKDIETTVAQETTESAVPNTGEYIFADSDSRYLTEEEVRQCSTESLSKARNELYARRHRIFTKDPWLSYFNSLSWYEGTILPKDFHEEQVFNEYEIANRDLIVRIENERK